MAPSCPNNCPQPILPLKYHLSTSPTINLYNDHNFQAPYHHIFIITITFISLVNNIEARLERAPPIISTLSLSLLCVQCSAFDHSAFEFVFHTISLHLRNTPPLILSLHLSQSCEWCAPWIEIIIMLQVLNMESH